MVVIIDKLYTRKYNGGMNTKTYLKNFNNHIAETRAANTARSYANAINKFQEYIGHKKLTPDNFVGYPAWLARKGYSKSTLGLYLAAVNNFFDWLIVNNFINPTYSEGVRFKKAFSDLMRRREYRLPRHADPEAVELIRKQAYEMKDASPIRERNIAVIEFFYTSGCRISEVCGVKLSDIEERETKVKVTGKGSKERWVVIDDLVIRRLHEYWKARGYQEKSNPMFCRHDDGAGSNVLPMSTVGMRDAVKMIAAAAGFPKFHPHLFRHNFGTKVLEETGDLAGVQDLMGHASPASTRVYAKVSTKKLKTLHQRAFK